MKIIFLAQTHYFDCCIPDSLDGYEVSKINLHYPNVESLRNAESDIWFFFCPYFFPKGLIDSMKGKKVWVSTEPIERPYELQNMVKLYQSAHFDYVTHYDKTHLEKMKSMGIKVDLEFQLPVNFNKYRPLKKEKRYDLFFSGRSTPHRETMMATLKRDYNLLHAAHGLIDDHYVELLNSSRIALNIHIDSFRQLQHRVQNMMACGVFVVSERLSHNDGIKEGEHYITAYNQGSLRAVVDYYLKHEEEADEISRHGYEYVRANFSAENNWLQLINQIL